MSEKQNRYYLFFTSDQYGRPNLLNGGFYVLEIAKIRAYELHAQTNLTYMIWDKAIETVVWDTTYSR